MQVEPREHASRPWARGILFDSLRQCQEAHPGYHQERMMAEQIIEEEHSHDFLDMMRHSTAHIMAEAVLSLFPDAKIGIGPTIEHGFYYDFDLPRPLTPEDLEVVEQKMRERIAQDVPFVRREVSASEARA